MNKRLALIAAGLVIALNLLILFPILGYARHTLNISGALSDYYRIGALLALPLVISPLLCAGVVTLLNSRRSDLLTKVRAALTEFAVGDYSSRIGEEGDREALALDELFQQIEQNIAHDRRRAEALSTVIHRAQSGILSVDADMSVIIATSRAKKLLGIVGSPEGLHIDEVLRDVHLEPLLRSAMGQEGVYTNEIATRTAGGRAKRPLRLYITPVRHSDGETLGAVAFVEDITELRRLEEVRTDFVANVSHELKTPLTSIKGFVETLQEGALSQPELAQKFLRIISMEAERLSRLINDILSISKLESGEDDVPMTRIHLDRLVADVVDMLRLNASEKQIEIYLTGSSAPAVIWGNEDRVDQMLINLIDNAVKYTLEGGSVTVSVFGARDQVSLLVADTGIGIAQEHMPRLFERFYRVDKSRSRSMGGTGLGLAIVKHIVHSMNGTIEVHSNLGKGTEFLIQLPACPEDDFETQ